MLVNRDCLVSTPLPFSIYLVDQTLKELIILFAILFSSVIMYKTKVLYGLKERHVLEKDVHTLGTSYNIILICRILILAKMFVIHVLLATILSSCKVHKESKAYLFFMNNLLQE